MDGSFREPEGGGVTLFGRWRVGALHRQRATIDAIQAAWRARPWPSPELLAYDVLPSTDGTTLLHRSQWTSADACRTAAVDPSWKSEVDRAVPGIERLGVVGCRSYRSRAGGADGPAPGCVVLVTRVFDGPDAERADGLVDALFDSTCATPAPVGLLVARFYVGLAGTHVFNWAEWTDEAAHRSAITRQLPATVDASRWQRICDWPGLTGTTFDRFHPALRLTASGAGEG